MKTVKSTSGGIDYLVGTLKRGVKTVTKSVFWKINHKTYDKEDVCLKIGRYNFFPRTPETLNPKSELTLDSVELKNLIDFISENYKPIKEGAKRYISIDESLDSDDIKQLRTLFDDPDKQKVITFVEKNNILPTHLLSALQHQNRLGGIREFEKMLSQNLLEQKWQEWFKTNSWVLGTEFVKILEEREIDTANITDYLIQAYDGFLDIIEIKRPDGGLKFWADNKDHGNYVPSSDLTKAVAQATRYIYEVEREANGVKFLERVGNIKTIKPRCVLIFGRSNGWDVEQRESYRILNSSYHNLTIMTYDHVLDRAKRILGLESMETERELSGKSLSVVETNEKVGIDDIPW